jgi:hypothetical protein
MRNVLLASAAALMLLPMSAKADIVLDTKLSGTGDNVVFDSVNVTGRTALGHLNDPNAHQEIVRFGALDFGTFGAADNGNDIKITGTNDLEIRVFDKTNTFVVGTTEQVFSLTGDGTVKLFVQANDKFGNAEALKTFTLDPLGNGQNGFTLTALNGEVMTSLIIFDTNGTITDFEHYRIDVAPTAAVPGPIAGAGIPGLIAGGLFMLGLARRRKKSV